MAIRIDVEDALIARTVVLGLKGSDTAQGGIRQEVRTKIDQMSFVGPWPRNWSADKISDHTVPC